MSDHKESAAPTARMEATHEHRCVWYDLIEGCDHPSIKHLCKCGATHNDEIASDTWQSTVSLPLTLRCLKCRREMAYDRSIDPTIPAEVAVIEQTFCDKCDNGDFGTERWLDVQGREVSQDTEYPEIIAPFGNVPDWLDNARQAMQALMFAGVGSENDELIRRNVNRIESALVTARKDYTRPTRADLEAVALEAAKDSRLCTHNPPCMSNMETIATQVVNHYLEKRNSK